MELDSSKIGNLELVKGTLRKDMPLFVWDAIRECTNIQCPVVGKCKYIHRGKCAVQVQYVESLYHAIFNTYSYLDEAMAFKIGVEIIPLYVQLVRLQIIELSVDNLVISTGKGSAIHPVLREIRDTLRCISSAWKSLDIAFEFGEKIRLRKEKPKEIPKPEAEENKEPEVVKPLVDFVNGDRSFYQKISKEGPSREGVIR
jgi:hypothetical protein